jgi:hypothetical protein
LEEIPETPPEQEQSLLISPPPLNRAPTSLYKERVTIHALRDAGFTLTAISEKVGKPVTTVSYIARNPTTPRKRAVIGHIFNTPIRRDLIRWLLSNPTHRRFSIGEIKQARGYTCSDTTLRRALYHEGYFRFKGKKAPYLRNPTRVDRVNYADLLLSMPRFEHQYIAWTDEGKQSIGGAANIHMWRQRGAEAWLEECMVPKFPKAGDSTVLYWIAFTYRSKCPLIFWDHKNWGNIDQWSYIEHILPTLRDWLRQEEEITGQHH